MAHGPHEETSPDEGWAVSDSAAGSGLSAFQTMLSHWIHTTIPDQVFHKYKMEPHFTDEKKIQKG